MKEVTTDMNIPTTQVSPYQRLAYSIDEACQMLSIGRTSLYEMAKRNEVRLIKIAGRTLVPLSELQRLTTS
jgi:excisionase family DNA binding protein